MKKVVKISLCRVPFTLEEEAYAKLGLYLDRLNAYYAKQPGGNEVMEGIEERLAELLAEQCVRPEGVVSLAMVVKVIDVMGTPETIEDGGETGESTHTPPENASAGRYVPKRFYRDMSNRVFAGVCAGLGHLCGTDPVVFRLLFVGLVVGLAVAGWGMSAGMAFLAYMVLWIVVPAARTVEQKCAMKGEPLSAKNIEERVYNSAYPYYEDEPRRHRNFWTVLGRVMAVGVGILALLVAIPCLMALVVGLAVGASMTFGGAAFGLQHLMPFVGLLGAGSATWLIKLLALLVVFLPFIWLVFLGCKLLFKLRGHNIGWSIFLLWILSLMGLAVTVSVATDVLDYRHYGSAKQLVTVNTAADTLYIVLPADFDWKAKRLYKGEEDEFDLVYYSDKNRDPKVAVYPRIRVVHGVADSLWRVESRGKAFSVTESMAEDKAKDNLPRLEAADSLLVLKPYIYEKHHPWDGAFQEVKIYVPEGKTLVVREPVRHRFGWNRHDED